MSLTPSLPDFSSDKLKSYWAKPEGKAAAVILLIAAGFGVFGFSLILPWLVEMMQDLFHLAILGGGLFAGAVILMNPTFRNIISNVFRLSLRWTLGWVIQLDPIGILKSDLDKMKERKEELDEAISGCAGAKRKVQVQIDKNNEAAKVALGRKAGTERQMADPSMTAFDKANASMRIRGFENDVTRRMDSNKRLTKVRDNADKLYQWLARWQQLADYKIEQTQSSIEVYGAERATILESYKGMRLAQRIIKGDPEQLKTVEATLEFLVNDNAEKMGAMEDFARVSSKYLANMDLDQSVSLDEAEKMFADLEQKMLAAPGEKVPLNMGTAPAEAVSTPRGKVEEVDYLGLDQK